MWPSGKNEKRDVFDLGNRRLGEKLDAWEYVRQALEGEALGLGQRGSRGT